MKKSYTLSLEKKEWNECLHNVYDKKKKDIKIDGFRKGQVPYDVYTKKAGVESLYMDAIDAAVDILYAKLLSDKETITPAATPSIDIKNIDSNGITIEFTLISAPEVKLGKYKDLGIKKSPIEVTEEEIEHELGHLREQFVEVKTLDDKAKIKEGNVAVIDFEGFLDGTPFKGGKGENYSLEIGSNTFIPGFEEQIIGMKANEEKDINVTFPEDYGVKDLAGAPVVFKVKVNEVKEKKTRELDEDFFEDLGMEGIDSEDKLKEEIKASIKAQKEMDAENKYVDSLLEGVSKNVEVDIPEEMVNEEVERLMGRFAEQMKMQGISLDLYYQFTGSNEEQLRSQMEKEAFNNVLYRLMIDEIKEIEKVVITDEEADKEAEELAKKYQVSKEEFLSQFGGLEMVKYDLEVRKVVELLKEYNK